MTFQHISLPQCPQCKENALKTIESRVTKQSTRRRKECGACGYRTTTHEVSAEFFDEAKQNLILVGQMRKLLGAGLPIPGVDLPQMGVEIKCDECTHNNGKRCAFDFPEYGTDESYDCSQYSLP